MTTNKQVVTAEFAEWLNDTSFSGRVSPGEQWNTESAWPSKETMKAACACFDAFVSGKPAEAEALLHEAQSPFV